MKRTVDTDAGMLCWHCGECGEPARTAHAHNCDEHDNLADAYYCHGKKDGSCRIDFVCDDCMISHDWDEHAREWDAA